MTTTEHFCRRGTKCATRTRTPNGWQPALVEHPGLCRPCEADTFDAIRALWGDWQRLDQALTTRPPTTPTARPGPGGGGGILNSAATTVWEAIADELSRWSNMVTGGDPLPTERHLFVHRAWVNVTTHLGTLVDQPARRYWVLLPLPGGGDFVGQAEWDGVDIVMRLADLHHQAQKALGDIDTRTWLPDPCHVCGTRALTPSRDQTLITCKACRNVWDADQFAALQNPFATTKGTQ